MLGVGRAYVHLLFNPERFFGERAARSIESKLGLPEGYMDRDINAKTMSVSDWDRVEALPVGSFAMVEMRPVQTPDGVGLGASDPGDVPSFPFRREWLIARGVSNRGRLGCMIMSDGSMEPRLERGDMLLVDSAQSVVQDGLIYAIVYGGAVRVRRLSKRFDGGLIIRPDNRECPDDTLTAEEARAITILGRVLWRAG